MSGPVRPAGGARPVRSPATGQDGLLLGLFGALQSLSSNRLLDRLIRGRMWIGLLAFALIGIVTLQLGLLKLNSGIGRAIELSAKLQTENASLSIENSELASGARVEPQAERLGMRLVPIEGLHFLYSHAREDVAHAAAVLREPVRPSAAAAAEAPQGGVAGGESEHRSASTSPGPSEATSVPAAGATAQPTTGEARSAPAEATSGAAATTGSAPPREAPASSAAERPSPSGASSTEPVGPAPGGGTASPAG